MTSHKWRLIQLRYACMNTAAVIAPVIFLAGDIQRIQRVVPTPVGFMNGNNRAITDWHPRSVISILPIVGIGNSDKEGEEWTTRDTLQCVYTFLFGFLIIMIDMKEDWVNKVFGLQTKLFLYCNFLATQTGRAGFYFYVGSITICLLPKSQLWSACYIVVGGCLCLLGLIMMGLRWCPWCQPEARASSTQLPAQS
ncbi:unnamed protein product [Polarella glacialis]|uniref:Uncharacterized protein n=1 Tax=Polarella glacialis TaxID=89957 RepID=A0A813G5U2_POLGL|nr:unnamed protein product [Polarella glacialis]